MKDPAQYPLFQPSYKESSDYLEKYKTCLDEALDMIKVYVVKSLESSTQAIVHRKVRQVQMYTISDGIVY